MTLQPLFARSVQYTANQEVNEHGGSDSDKALPATLVKDELHYQCVQYTHLNKQLSPIESVMFCMYGRSVIYWKNSLLNSLNVMARIGSSVVPVVHTYLSFNSQSVILVIFCQGIRHI